MPITAHQLRQRKNHLGSSDVAALFGLNKFANAHDVWLEKTGQLAEAPVNEAQALGNEFEPIILARAEKELGPLKRNQYRSARDLGLPLRSNIDAIVIETGRPVEAKTSGIWWPVEEVWGEPGTNQVPNLRVSENPAAELTRNKAMNHKEQYQWAMKCGFGEVMIWELSSASMRTPPGRRWAKRSWRSCTRRWVRRNWPR